MTLNNSPVTFSAFSGKVHEVHNDLGRLNLRSARLTCNAFQGGKVPVFFGSKDGRLRAEGQRTSGAAARAHGKLRSFRETPNQCTPRDLSKTGAKTAESPGAQSGSQRKPRRTKTAPRRPVKKFPIAERPGWSPEGFPHHRDSEDTEEVRRGRNPCPASALPNRRPSTALFFKNRRCVRTSTEIHLSHVRSERPVSRHSLCDFLCVLGVSHIEFGRPTFNWIA